MHAYSSCNRKADIVHLILHICQKRVGLEFVLRFADRVHHETLILYILSPACMPHLSAA